MGVVLQICVPYIPAGESRKRPAPVRQKAVSDGELLPIAAFISFHQAPVVAGPQPAGLLLIFDGDDVPRWSGLQEMILKLQNVSLARKSPESRLAQPDLAIGRPCQSHAACGTVFLRARDYSAARR